MRLKFSHQSSGFTMVEFVLFLAIFVLIGSAIIGLLMSTQDARIKQRSIADIEQVGTQILLNMTRTARRAEQVLDPPPGESGSVLTLQMASTIEFPTIYAGTSSGEFLQIQRTEVAQLTSENITVTDLTFRNTSSENAKSFMIAFTLHSQILLPNSLEYTKTFRSAVTLYPDDLGEAGGCGSCAMTGCVNGTSYEWSYCAYEECLSQSLELSC